MPIKKRKNSRKTINLALQGGGTHGAFAWGFLDKIIEDGRIDVEGLCATSSGTMNACAYAYGMMKGGNEKARETLHNFWWKIHQAGEKYSPIRRLPWEIFLNGNWNMDNSFSFFMFDSITRTFSPYQLNPFDFNPLRDVVNEVIDFEKLRKCKCTNLFISATHVKTGKVRVFHNEEVTLDVAMASAYLPYVFKAVTIKGEDYWDGGYMGNPPLYPLFYNTKCRDVLIIHINPMLRENTPTTAPDIMNRINEISFNSSLYKELRAIAFVKKLKEYKMLKKEHEDSFKNVLVHSVRADEAMSDLSVASKLNSDWQFLTMLRDKGRLAMETWLDKNFQHIGKKDTVDLHAEFLCSINKIFEKNHESTNNHT
ncbi:MAG: patatin-like phospholipase family protein [Rickettsiales bacterium]|nr:patatin-like phospholipase family protein [Rickettsiales bacterium]